MEKNSISTLDDTAKTFNFPLITNSEGRLDVNNIYYGYSNFINELLETNLLESILDRTISIIDKKLSQHVVAAVKLNIAKTTEGIIATDFKDGIEQIQKYHNDPRLREYVVSIEKSGDIVVPPLPGVLVTDFRDGKTNLSLMFHYTYIAGQKKALKSPISINPWFNDNNHITLNSENIPTVINLGSQKNVGVFTTESLTNIYTLTFLNTAFIKFREAYTDQINDCRFINIIDAANPSRLDSNYIAKYILGNKNRQSVLEMAQKSVDYFHAELFPDHGSTQKIQSVLAPSPIFGIRQMFELIAGGLGIVVGAPNLKNLETLLLQSEQ